MGGGVDGGVAATGFVAGGSALRDDDDVDAGGGMVVLRVERRARWRNLVLLAGLLVVNMLVHYLAAFVLVALLVCRRAHARDGVAENSGAVAAAGIVYACVWGAVVAGAARECEAEPGFGAGGERHAGADGAGAGGDRSDSTDLHKCAGKCDAGGGGDGGVHCVWVDDREASLVADGASVGGAAARGDDADRHLQRIGHAGLEALCADHSTGVVHPDRGGGVAASACRWGSFANRGVGVALVNLPTTYIEWKADWRGLAKQLDESRPGTEPVVLVSPPETAWWMGGAVMGITHYSYDAQSAFHIADGAGAGGDGVEHVGDCEQSATTSGGVCAGIAVGGDGGVAEFGGGDSGDDFTPATQEKTDQREARTLTPALGGGRWAWSGSTGRCS